MRKPTKVTDKDILASITTKLDKTDLASGLVEMYRVEDRQDGDVDCTQMADKWDVDTRTSRIRLDALVKRGILERFKVRDPQHPRPIFIWRERISDNGKSAIIKTHIPKRRRG